MMPKETSQIDAVFLATHKTDEIQFLDAGKQWKLNIRNHAWRPPTDIYETDDWLIVRVEIAGMQENDFEISLTGRNLTIHGIRPDLAEKRAYHQMEIHSGEFLLELEMPLPIISDQVQAVYQNGFLRVVIPKAQPRHIPINL